MTEPNQQYGAEIPSSAEIVVKRFSSRRRVCAPEVAVSFFAWALQLLECVEAIRISSNRSQLAPRTGTSSPLESAPCSFVVKAMCGGRSPWGRARSVLRDVNLQLADWPALDVPKSQPWHDPDERPR
jgi:hypothetical protein